MKTAQDEPRKFYAITILKRGSLSKQHLADPSVGLSRELKKAQVPPVEVVLTLLSKKSFTEVLRESRERRKVARAPNLIDDGGD